MSEHRETLDELLEKIARRRYRDLRWMAAMCLVLVAWIFVLELMR